jgi:predicted nucleotidyltransferase
MWNTFRHRVRYEDELRDIFEEVKTALIKYYGDTLVKLSYFGSYAEGTPKPESDLDVFLFLDKEYPPNWDTPKLYRDSYIDGPKEKELKDLYGWVICDLCEKREIFIELHLVTPRTYADGQERRGMVENLNNDRLTIYEHPTKWTHFKRT